MIRVSYRRFVVCASMCGAVPAAVQRLGQTFIGIGNADDDEAQSTHGDGSRNETQLGRLEVFTRRSGTNRFSGRNARVKTPRPVEFTMAVTAAC